MTGTTGAMGATTTEHAPTLGGASVRTRITAAVALLAGLALSGAGLLVYVLESSHVENEVADQVEQELDEFATLQREGRDPATTQPFTDVTRLIELFLSRNVPDEDELLVGYWDGAPQLRSGRHLDLVDDPAFRRVVSDRVERGGSQTVESARFGEVLVTVQPVRSRRTTGALVIANFVRDERAELNRVMSTYAAVSAVSLVLITAVAAWQAGRLLAPVRTLRETAQGISSTDLSQRIPDGAGNDDITALTRTVNDMLDRLERAFTSQRQFLDDAGHELKTPLTILRGHLEVTDSSDPREVEATRTLLLDEIDRMALLIEDLITLAKTDRPDFLAFRPVDLAPFTETVLDKVRALGQRTWRLDEVADVAAHVDERRLGQALIQLAQNAVKHTVPGDEIGIGSRVDPQGWVQLWVRDTGHGVREEDKQVIFERFGRGEVLAGDDGAGLGLSIVSAIAAAHGGTVTVEDVVPRGARFVLTVPVRRATPAVRRSAD